MGIRVFVVTWVMVFVGCGIFGEGEVLLSTDEGVYTLDSNTVIHLKASNETETSVYYICTGQVYLEERIQNELKGSWMVHGFEECYSAMPIEAGKSETFDVDLGLLQEYGLLTGPVFDETVTYRLRVDIYKDDKFEVMVSEAQRETAEIQIVRAE